MSILDRRNTVYATQGNVIAIMYKPPGFSGSVCREVLHKLDQPPLQQCPACCLRRLLFVIGGHLSRRVQPAILADTNDKN